MKNGKLDKRFICIVICSITLGICACGRRKDIDNGEMEQNISKEQMKECEQDFMKDQTAGAEGDVTTEAKIFDLQEAKTFISDMNHDKQELAAKLDEQSTYPITEKEITDCISQYFDESLTDYAMFLYRIRPVEGGFVHDRRYGAANFTIDTEVEMTVVTQADDFCEIGVTFEHHWERSWDKDVVPVRLERQGDVLKITEISQWYNDFRYKYMPDELFTPKSFSKQDAQDVIERFGTDVDGRPVLLSITTDEEHFILAGSSETLLTENEIERLSKFEMYMAVQEIYARHGKKFSDVILCQYFNRQEWYKPYEKVFSKETLSEIEEANIELLIQKGSLGEEAGKEYGNLYPDEGMKETILTEEEAVGMIIHAFHMADEVICAKEENYIRTEDVFQIYSLGEYSDERKLQNYLSAWFSEEAIDYVINVYTMCSGLYRNEENRSYQYITEGTPYGEWQEIDLLERAKIIQVDENSCRVELPFFNEQMAWWGFPEGVSRGEILLCRTETGWIINEMAQSYYDALYQEYLQE